MGVFGRRAILTIPKFEIEQIIVVHIKTRSREG